MKANGHVFKYGDNVDTDVIIPARHLAITDPKGLAAHCMEDIDAEFVKRVQPGDIIVANKNFGCGSSREHAPIAIKASGVSCVIAETFARIFYRNAINIGLPIIECKEAAEGIEAGDEVEIDFDSGMIYNKTKGTQYMDNYITGGMIKRLREEKGFTQAELAGMIGVSDKAVSKWERAKGLPDITLIKPISEALGVSVMELMSGSTVTNRNISSNILRSKFYVCPVCGNCIHAMGDSVISCCGITLPPLEAEDGDDIEHKIIMENVEDEKFVRVEHPMTKDHYISFMAYISFDRVQLVKLYPEGNAEARFNIRGRGFIYIYCNRHGLMRTKT